MVTQTRKALSKVFALSVCENASTSFTPTCWKFGTEVSNYWKIHVDFKQNSVHKTPDWCLILSRQYRNCCVRWIWQGCHIMIDLSENDKALRNWRSQQWGRGKFCVLETNRTRDVDQLAKGRMRNWQNWRWAEAGKKEVNIATKLGQKRLAKLVGLLGAHLENAPEGFLKDG